MGLHTYSIKNVCMESPMPHDRCGMFSTSHHTIITRNANNPSPAFTATFWKHSSLIYALGRAIYIFLYNLTIWFYQPPLLLLYTCLYTMWFTFHVFYATPSRRDAIAKLRVHIYRRLHNDRCKYTDTQFLEDTFSTCCYQCVLQPLFKSIQCQYESRAFRIVVTSLSRLPVTGSKSH